MASSQGYAPPGAELLIQLAWKSLKLAFETMPWLFVGTAFVAALVGLAEQQLPSAFLVAGIQSPVVAVALFVASTVGLVALKAFVLAPVAVAVHRQILLTETAPNVVSLLVKRTWIFVGWVLGLELVTCAVVLPALVGGKLSWLLMAAAIIATVVICVRSALVFPSVAIDVTSESWNLRLKTSWDQTRGVFWTLFWALLGAVLPVVLPLVLVALVVSAVAIFGFGIIGLPGPFMKFLYGALDPVITALGAAVASWMYLWVTDRSRAEMTD